MAANGWVQPWRKRPPAVSLPAPAPTPGSGPAVESETTVADRGTPPSVVPSPEPYARSATATPPPGVPQANRAGTYSLARQLGLTARTIVVDAGHGGHDPGSIGPAGLQEKELVLDVALRLEKLLRTRLGAQVVMTRSTDVFVALEERTAIANTKGADLFLSVHANSSRSSRSRGIETYFLNFARNRHAESVAARENAISEATLKDLQGLVKAIALNSKIDESRDFAASVQEAMVDGLKAASPDVLDRGVHTAPFYVLIGANMPSVLAEISFVSNPAEERLLKKSDHRDRIAQSLFTGVRSYLEVLNRGPLRKLTSRTGAPTVASRARR
jgi:N-acetylmuramoyl-L-alanine amidase